MQTLASHIQPTPLAIERAASFASPGLLAMEGGTVIHGRLRAARLGPDGALYVTTTNGDNDKLLRVTPA